ncbi:MAG: hypothetical protein LKM30_01660 [Bacilli bacterium]|jgi:hypothetical protein|nr:hypothetical protein [Bacilli bacterium]
MKIVTPSLKKLEKVGHGILAGHDELLRKFYDVDSEKMLVTATFHFQKASDFIDTSVGNKGHYLLQPAVWDKIEETYKRIPNVYSINYVFDIQDMEGHTVDELLAVFEENIELAFYDSRLALTRKRKTAILLTLVGVILLVTDVAIRLWSGISDLNREIISEVIDIAAWVFVWEAVSVYFLEGGELRSRLRTIHRRINEVSIVTATAKGSDTNENLFSKDDSFLTTAETHLPL